MYNKNIDITSLINEILLESDEFGSRYADNEMSNRALGKAMTALKPNTTRSRTNDSILLAHQVVEGGANPIGAGQAAYNALTLALKNKFENLLIKTDTGSNSFKGVIRAGEYKFGKSCFAFKYNVSGYKNGKAGKWVAGRRDTQTIYKIYPGEIKYAAQLTPFGNDAFFLCLDNPDYNYVLIMGAKDMDIYQRDLYFKAFDEVVYRMNG